MPNKNHITLKRASSADSTIIQEILEAAPRYGMNTQGKLASANAEAETLSALPPNCTDENKYVFIVQHQGANIGVIDLIDGYPEREIAFLGLLLLREDHQNKRLGAATYEALQKWISAHLRSKKIRLSVFDTNPVIPFWEKMGFHLTGESRAHEENIFKPNKLLMEKELSKTIECKITRPSLEFVKSFLEYAEAMKNAEKVIFWSEYSPFTEETHSDFIHRQLKRELDPEPGLVAETVYWGIFENTVIGRISLRHTLNKNLSKMGGHIGYEIHPAFRKRGFATQMLRELLKTPKAIEIGNLLLTCHPDNIASNKTIVSNGGVLKEKIFVESVSEYRNHYWINMKNKNSIILIGDHRVKAIPVIEYGEPLIDLIKNFPDLRVDLERHHVQKKSATISFARITVAQKLMDAQKLLPNGILLLIKECHRPMSVQKGFWDNYTLWLKNKYPDWSDEKLYDECSKLNAPLDVAPHTTGGAVDLTLTDADGKWLDMGTEFNASPHETAEATYTHVDNISDLAKANRKLLIDVMTQVGFVNYPTEWWHWSYGDKYWALNTQQPHAIYGTIEVGS